MVLGDNRDILRNVTLLLRRSVAAVVVCHAHAGGAVEVADDFDLVGWGS